MVGLEVVPASRGASVTQHQKLGTQNKGSLPVPKARSPKSRRLGAEHRLEARGEGPPGCRRAGLRVPLGSRPHRTSLAVGVWGCGRPSACGHPSARGRFPPASASALPSPPECPPGLSSSREDARHRLHRDLLLTNYISKTRFRIRSHSEVSGIWIVEDALRPAAEEWAQTVAFRPRRRPQERWRAWRPGRGSPHFPRKDGCSSTQGPTPGWAWGRTSESCVIELF